MLIPDTEQYQIALGGELRRMRKARGWTRSDVLSRLSMSISTQTLAAWEHGTRALNVTRFAELCLTLGDRPHAVLERVDHAVIGGHDTAISMDLASVVEIAHPELRPLRQWAAARLSEGGTTAVTLPPAAVARMAQLCDIPSDQLRVELAHAGGVGGEGSDVGRWAS
ncbi:helix-turn-helix domain-containing protein [Haloechinothrix halophila]|uniref:helix-turn-helix domain-containing protein n=1 Tax=Haloechinothrix halophila TaxID=1069073 RepID=UPI00041A1679|nr:helix-turn-helix transcriptional regulator [Haloechinothrix halophila]